MSGSVNVCGWLIHRTIRWILLFLIWQSELRGQHLSNIVHVRYYTNQVVLNTLWDSYSNQATKIFIFQIFLSPKKSRDENFQNKKEIPLCTYQCNAGEGEAGHRVGIWLFSKICNQIPCPRANHSSQMQPNLPTPECTLLSIPRQNLRKAQQKYVQIKLCNLL